MSPTRPVGGERLTARDLDRMFNGHRSIPELREKLVRLGIAREVERETGGRPAVVLTLADKAEQAEKVQWWTRVTYRREGCSASSASCAADARARGVGAA